MQEDIERRSIALSITATKWTARVLAACLMYVARKIQKEIREGKTPKGKQSLKKLMNHKGPTNTIPLDGDTKLFDHIAREYHVDYAYRQVGPDKYILCFRSAQADAITACFSEYAKKMEARAADPRTPIKEQLKHYGDVARTAAPRAPSERERVIEAVRE